MSDIVSKMTKTKPGMVTHSNAPPFMLEGARGQSTETDSHPSVGAKLLAAALKEANKEGFKVAATKNYPTEDEFNSDD